MSHDDEGWKRAFIRFVAGGSAGFIEVAIMHPLDLVKTRIQLQPSTLSPNDPHYYSGIIDCFKKLYQQEGVLALWKGLTPPLIVETPTKSVRFTAFHHYKRILSGDKPPSLLIYMTSGYLAGFTESFVICPFEVVKVTQQANTSKMSETPSSWTTAKKIMREGGLMGRRGIYRGLGATIYRHSVFTTVYLGLFYSIRDNVNIKKTGSSVKDTMVTLAIGVGTGAFACLFNIPFDVVKSRIQAPQPDKLKYVHTWQSINTIFHEEGFRALYKGLLPKVLRLGPGGAILIIVFETVDNIFSKLFKK